MPHQAVLDDQIDTWIAPTLVYLSLRASHELVRQSHHSSTINSSWNSIKLASGSTVYNLFLGEPDPEPDPVS